MATRALTKQPADWRAAFRRSAAHALRITGAVGLFALLGFLTLALLSYTATDPSPSTAAADVAVANWMGAAGAWVAERLFLPFGICALLLLPMLHRTALRLWHGDTDDAGEERAPRWKPWLLLGGAAAMLGTVLALLFDGPDSLGSSLPAGAGGLVGLLGAKLVAALAGTAGAGLAGWITLALALVALAGAVVLLTRLFALDWSRLRAIPALARRSAAGEATTDASAEAVTEALLRPREAAPSVLAPAAPVAPAAEDTAPRRSPTITDPSAAPRRAAPQPQQSDMFAEFALPPLDLLTDAGEERVQPLDKVALERNARLLENVLDDFNVKGEITAVRTGPVVTMYELEPAPASRPAAWSASPKT
jgi:S-DNA-T family DNA segregation ATPase FtsK/SpoIIIE